MTMTGSSLATSRRRLTSELAFLHLGEQVRRVGVGGLGRLIGWRPRRIERRVVRAILLRFRGRGGRLGFPEQCLELSLVHRANSGVKESVPGIECKLASSVVVVTPIRHR